jgi:hypothetical protein
MRHLKRKLFVAAGSALMTLTSAMAVVTPKIEPQTVNNAKATQAVASGHSFIVEPREQFLQHVRERAAAAKAEGRTLTVRDLTSGTGKVVMLDESPVKNQLDRGTCWAFAGASALEAAYKHKYHINIQVSPQYVFHVGKVFELFPSYTTAGNHENNSALWGFQGASDVIQKMVRTATCEERFAPYLDGTSMTQDQIKTGTQAITAPNTDVFQNIMDKFDFYEHQIPSAARANCIYQAVSSKALNANPSVAEIQGVLNGGHEVVVDIVLDCNTNASTWEYDSTVKNGGGHVVVLCGYDDNRKVFIAKNSWGTAVGNKGYFDLTYNFIQKCCSWGNYITDVTDPKAGPQKQAFWLGEWNMDHDGWRGNLIIRRFTDFHSSNASAPTKIGNYTYDGKTYDVNGYFDQNGQHCAMWIATNPGKIKPGTESGQRYDMYCYSWDINYAAGRTNSDNQPYGVIMSRPALPPFVKKAFAVNDWIGTYAMNHDGWHGTLHITSANPLKGSYTDTNGKTWPISGNVGGKPYELSMTIAFPGAPQKFDLLHHTWERGIFSGTTVWDKQTFGVLGYLK